MILETWIISGLVSLLYAIKKTKRWPFKLNIGDMTIMFIIVGFGYCSLILSIAHKCDE